MLIKRVLPRSASVAKCVFVPFPFYTPFVLQVNLHNKAVRSLIPEYDGIECEGNLQGAGDVNR